MNLKFTSRFHAHVFTNGDVIFDLGQNAAHIPKISVTGPAGSRVRIIPSELGDGW